jgi:hypothetical protein
MNKPKASTTSTIQGNRWQVLLTWSENIEGISSIYFIELFSAPTKPKEASRSHQADQEY